MPILFPETRPPLVIIVGPTASGKSALALALAEKQAGTVINADSAQVYADLSVLSARPTAAEMARAPHRLFGYRDGAQSCSAADWACDAKAAIAEAHTTNRLPILVGGTGLYIRTLLDGIAPVPEVSPEIRGAVRAMSVDQANVALHREDPVMAERLRPTDTTRIMRALEVVRSSGRSLAEWQLTREGGIANLVTVHGAVLLPPRDALYARCDARFQNMLETGAVEEVAGLIQRKLPADAPVLRAIGVAEIAALLRNDVSEEAAVIAAQAATRQYAKRQYTWFRNQTPPIWPRIDELVSIENCDAIVRILQNAWLT
ncbi:MAG: tRNA (adenosine(37)-N6)-dimethylallyltransferase MiaA [Parasphingorhabdus sp.]|nr:tRNA (adenosine(37)-N6)-dimethylallyltransferase MiaA [Parasphingorhabdus sp.]